MSVCGCACPCHVDEDKPEWPGSCAGCCDHELNRYDCKCAAYMRGYERARAALIAELEAGVEGLRKPMHGNWDSGWDAALAAVLALLEEK